jgi:hypothetical protein
VDGKFIYFTNAEGQLVSVPKMGGAPAVVASGFDRVIGRSNLVMRQAEVLFGVDPQTPDSNSGRDGKVVAVDVTSGRVRTLAGEPNVSLVPQIEADGSCVYWYDIRWVAAGGESCSSVSIKRAPRG